MHCIIRNFGLICRDLLAVRPTHAFSVGLPELSHLTVTAEREMLVYTRNGNLARPISGSWEQRMDGELSATSLSCIAPCCLVTELMNHVFPVASFLPVLEYREN